MRLTYLLPGSPVFWLLSFWSFFSACQGPAPEAGKPARPAYALALHGGAGYLERASLTPEKEARYRALLDSALHIGEDILQAGGSSLDAVEAVIVFLENAPEFNAGRGAVFTHEGHNELDAAIMDGATRAAGAVAGVRQAKNPIRAARAVMAHSPHVLLSGAGADRFAAEQGLDTVPNRYFYTPDAFEHLQRVQAEEAGKKTGLLPSHPDPKFGTVGCVALDGAGNLAAGTSTGGMTNKRWGRIGDAPIIGAGTFADNASCAVSCTGHGEYFIRYAVAHELSAMLRHGQQPLGEAAERLIMRELKAAGGNGGLIALDAEGHVAMPFNTGSMFRAYAKPGERHIAIFPDAATGH